MILAVAETGWVSSKSPAVCDFEHKLSDFLVARARIAVLTCCNGATALELALLEFGVKPGDKVLVPALLLLRLQIL